MDYILAIGIGSLAGVTWEYLSNKAFKHFSTLAPSYYLNGIHLHHWLWYLLVLIIVVLVANKTNRISHPSVLMIVSAIVSALIYGFVFLDGWGKFWK